MPWTNYHSHCNYCDGKGEAEDYVKKAVSNGLLAYGYSSHCPVPFDTEWSMKISDLDGYYSHINRIKSEWKNKIQVYCGLEVDFIPGKVGPASDFLKSPMLDYTIGSIHFIDSFEDGTPWEIDGPHSLFLKGFGDIFNSDIRRVIERYYELTRMMVEQECPDVVGHLDKIKIQNVNGKLFREEEKWYRAAVVKTLETIAVKGIIVEINTRGIYKKATSDVYPSEWILQMMNDMKIPVMINSDAHHPREITGEFRLAAQKLLEAGYTELSVLLDDRWQSFPFSKNGLDITVNAE